MQITIDTQAATDEDLMDAINTILAARFLTTAQMARVKGIKPKSVRNYYAHRIPSFDIPAMVFYSRNDVEGKDNV